MPEDKKPEGMFSKFSSSSSKKPKKSAEEITEPKVMVMVDPKSVVLEDMEPETLEEPVPAPPPATVAAPKEKGALSKLAGHPVQKKKERWIRDEKKPSAHKYFQGR